MHMALKKKLKKSRKQQINSKTSIAELLKQIEPLGEYVLIWNTLIWILD
jgi:Mg2+/Co2+ transporter CorB